MIRGFSADGRLVVVKGVNGRDICCDLATGRQVGPEFAGRPFLPEDREQRSALGLLNDPSYTPRAELMYLQLDPAVATIFFWNLVPARGTAERARVWAEVLTGMELEESGQTRPLDEAALADRRNRLAALGGPPVP